MDDDALDDLYAGDFDGFVGRRDALAKKLRADGDREGADAVKALKKPNQPAWALNQLGTKQRDRLLKAGQALREAQEQVVAGDADPDDLREATDAERTAVSEALGAATALAEKEGTALSEQAGERARQTLHAVARDEEVRREFERGRLTTDHDAPGLGELVLGDVKPSGKGKARKKKQSARARAGQAAPRGAQVGRGAGQEAELTPRGRRARGGGSPQGGRRARSTPSSAPGSSSRRRPRRPRTLRSGSAPCRTTEGGNGGGGRSREPGGVAGAAARARTPAPTSKSRQRADDFSAGCIASASRGRAPGSPSRRPCQSERSEGAQAPEAHSVTPSWPARRFTSCVLMLRSSSAAVRIF